jgi:glycosyltransferase involved in cell wall biosynthesis
LVFDAELGANIVAAGASRRLRRPVPIVLRADSSVRAGSGPMGRWFARRAYRRADAVVAPARGLRREMIREHGLTWARIVTLSNPVEVAAIGQAADVARALPSPSPGGPLILSMVRMNRQKGFDILIDRFAGLRTEGARLALPGDGPERTALAARAQRLGVPDRVILPGFVEEPTPWLAHADVVVSPSRSEGLGQAIVESIAAGVPVKSTDCPHGPADIIDDGKIGVLMPFGERLEERLWDQIDGLLASPVRRRAIRDVAAVAVREFESETVAVRYADLFRRVIAQRREADIIDERIR